MRRVDKSFRRKRLTFGFGTDANLSCFAILEPDGSNWVVGGFRTGLRIRTVVDRLAGVVVVVLFVVVSLKYVAGLRTIYY